VIWQSLSPIACRLSPAWNYRKPLVFDTFMR